MKQIVVAAALIIKDGNVFAAQRKDSGDLAKKWEFPGGKLEAGESGEEAIVREIREELSAKIAVTGYLMTVEHTYPAFHITMHAYLCELEAGDLVLSEHLDSRWLGPDELYDVDWAAADLPIVERAKALLANR
nr:(deoxy)nucleoside triphosphate pyrophosphohydrolase [uncultured Sphaerochaeta sp.]